MPNRQGQVPPSSFDSKKCPYCENYLSVEDRFCFACNKRVGKLNKKTGMAEHPVAAASYIICLLSWASFIFYLWWAFFR